MERVAANQAREAKRRPSSRPRLAALGPTLALLAASCARTPPAATTLDADKVGSVVIRRSSRADVFAALGRPDQTRRSPLGETWVYEPKADSGSGQQFASGAAAVAGVAGAFVPYVGLLGSGLGLAGLAAGSQPEPDPGSLAVSFGDDGVVRDCVYSSTASPAGMPGAAEAPGKPIGCRSPGGPGAAGS